MTTNTTTHLGPADEALLAAEREIAELWRKRAELTAAGDREDHPEIGSKAFALDTYIAKLAPDSLVGAAVKLRRLADEDIGLEAGEGEGDVESVRQILALVERSIEPAPVPCAGTDTASPEKHAPSLAARATEALALRHLSRYRAVREDVEDLPDTPSYEEMDARYRRLMVEVTSEPPGSVDGEERLIELIESIIADAISPHEGPVVGEEEDLCDALRMLHLIKRQANRRGIAEVVQAERLRFGLTPAGDPA